MGVLTLYLDLFALKLEQKPICTKFFPISLVLKDLMRTNCPKSLKS